MYYNDDMNFHPCPLCFNKAHVVFTTIVLSKFEAKYALCKTCGLLFATNPIWLNEAYENPIALNDSGIIRRNISNAARLTGILFLLFGKDKKFLDYAGGSGLFTRIMRDIGLDFYCADKYCINLMSAGFNHKTEYSYAAITAFEVLEHVPNPFEFIYSILEEIKCDTIILSTTVFEKDIPPSLDWHYYTFKSGQHICFYQPRTLDFLAQRMGMNYLRGGNLHLFTRKKLSPFVFRFFTSKCGIIVSLFCMVFLRSFTKKDFAASS